MERKKIYIIIIVAVLIVVVGFGGYYAYGAYKDNKTKEYMLLAAQHNKTSSDLNETWEQQADARNYDGLIDTLNKGILEQQKVVMCDTNATNYADGVFKDYLTNDIMRANMSIKQFETLINWLEEEKKGTITLASSTEYKKQYDDFREKASEYANKRDEIKAANPQKFKFIEPLYQNG